MKLYKLMRKPPFFMSVSHFITKNDHPIKYGPDSRKANLVPLLMMQYGSMKAKLRLIRGGNHNTKGAIVGIRKSAKSIKMNPHQGKRHMDDQTLADMEAFAKSLGILSIGYAKVNPNFIFHKFEILYDNAMIISMEMDKEKMDTNPSLISNGEIMRTYYELGVVVNKIADFLRERGYNCHPSPALGGDINTVPTAQDANLGCIGKNGILVLPEVGPCARLAAVFIDVDNLPFAKENEHMWIADFCETCNQCIKACPGDAIYMESLILEDGTKRYIDCEKCAPPFSEGCSQCITSCVFHGGHYNKIKEAYDKKRG